ncbi:MAG: hypothetical protein LAT64_05635 [Phycisphaerales bacterium]|nr:hypothetical protein [Planctomycetota bacterium]MCH8508238.1 hypothetical protein [Phycisphaerales bacterium]
MGAWQDRFQTPTAEMLMAELPADAAVVLREAIRRIGGRPKPVWIDSWNWTLGLQPAAGPAYLIPDPQCPRLAARIPKARFASFLRHRENSKTLKSALLAAGSVGEVVWTEWALTDEETLGTVLAAVLEAETP